MGKKALVLYAKYPKPGHVKTRLTEQKNGMTPAEASELYSAILVDLITKFSKSSLESEYDFFVCIKENINQFREMITVPLNILEDTGCYDLGDSLFNSFKQLAQRDYFHINIIGSDIPLITTKLIDKAFLLLTKSCDFLIGPDQSGGCYLIGSNHPYSIFDEIPWSQGKDFNLLFDRAMNKGIRVSILPEIIDLDKIVDFISIYQMIKNKPISFRDNMPRTYQFFKVFHVKHPFFLKL